MIVLKIEFECIESLKDTIEKRLREITNRPDLVANRAYNNYCACVMFQSDIKVLVEKVNDYLKSMYSADSNTQTLSYYSVNTIIV